MIARNSHRGLAGHYDERAGTYRVFGNGTLLAAVLGVLPQGGAVLDVGCASGGLLRELEGVAGRRVGLELSAEAAAAAREVADEVVVGDVADPDLPLERGAFDVVILADVIEHTATPGDALRQALRFCKPGGRVVVSVPNVAHWSARVALARGRWDYAESGLFDVGHLRWYTLRTLLAELESAGLRIDAVDAVVPRLGNHVPSLARLPGRVSEATERGWARLGRRRPTLLGYQWLVVATLPSPGVEPVS